MLHGAGPVPGFFLHLAGGRGQPVLARIDVPAGQFRRRQRTGSEGSGLAQYRHSGCSAIDSVDWSTRAPHSGQVAGTFHRDSWSTRCTMPGALGNDAPLSSASAVAARCCFSFARMSFGSYRGSPSI